jgi:RNA exonuclease 4
VSKSSQDKIGKFIAIDCEMVGIGPEGKESALARVSIVNFNGRVIMDKYVRTMERVTDYRTHVSGITPHHLANGHDFSTIQKEVAEIIKDRIIIGHAIKNDLTALLLEHPRRLIRDTAKFKPFRQLTSGRTPSLRALAEHYLKKQIQSGQHCSVSESTLS